MAEALQTEENSTKRPSTLSEKGITFHDRISCSPYYIAKISR